MLIADLSVNHLPDFLINQSHSQSAGLHLQSQAYFFKDKVRLVTAIALVPQVGTSMLVLHTHMHSRCASTYELSYVRRHIANICLYKALCIFAIIGRNLAKLFLVVSVHFYLEFYINTKELFYYTPKAHKCELYTSFIGGWSYGDLCCMKGTQTTRTRILLHVTKLVLFSTPFIAIQSLVNDSWINNKI